jgi:hypothetical protein
MNTIASEFDAEARTWGEDPARRLDRTGFARVQFSTVHEVRKETGMGPRSYSLFLVVAERRQAAYCRGGFRTAYPQPPFTAAFDCSFTFLANA